MSIGNQSNKNILETQAFSTQLDKTIFVERLDINDNITPHFILRQEFNNKNRRLGLVNKVYF
jgi:hypothetical protein